MQESEGVLCMRVSFRIALAGQVIGVSALYEQTRTFCKNYLTDGFFKQPVYYADYISQVVTAHTMMLASFSFSTIQNGTLQISDVERFMTLADDRKAANELRYVDLNSAFQAVADQNTTQQERQESYEKYEAEQEKRIQELEEEISAITGIHNDELSTQTVFLLEGQNLFIALIQWINLVFIDPVVDHNRFRDFLILEAILNRFHQITADCNYKVAAFAAELVEPHHGICDKFALGVANSQHLLRVKVLNVVNVLGVFHPFAPDAQQAGRCQVLDNIFHK